MVGETNLTDYSGNVPFDLPRVLHKGQSIIRIDGFVWSSSAKKYYNVSFIGTLLEHDGLAEEYILGHLEVDKKTGAPNPSNMRYSRFTNLKQIAKFANLLGDYITQKKTKVQ